MKYFTINKNCFVVLFLISHLSFLISAQAAEAHVLKSDGSVGAVLHVSPDDDPVAGVPTDFFFEFKDKTGRFTPENCTCIASVSQNGQEIYSQPLFQNSVSPSLENASFTYTLPQKGIYTVQVKGLPQTVGTFDPFTLFWDIRVESEGQNGSAAAERNWIIDSLQYLLGFAIFIAVLVFVKKKGGGK